MEGMTVEEEWLESLMSEHTKDHHQRSLKYFKEFLGNLDTERLIEMKKEERTFETRVIIFFKWLQDTKGQTQNTARSYCIGVQSFFSYVGLPLRLRNKLPKLHMKLGRIQTYSRGPTEALQIWRSPDQSMDSLKQRLPSQDRRSFEDNTRTDSTRRISH